MWVFPAQGEIFVAGGNSDGQLGLGHCNGSVSFQCLRPFCDYAPIKLLCAGDHTSAALTGNNDMQQKVSFIVDINLLLYMEMHLHI